MTSLRIMNAENHVTIRKKIVAIGFCADVSCIYRVWCYDFLKYKLRSTCTYGSSSGGKCILCITSFRGAASSENETQANITLLWKFKNWTILDVWWFYFYNDSCRVHNELWCNNSFRTGHQTVTMWLKRQIKQTPVNCLCCNQLITRSQSHRIDWYKKKLDMPS